MKNHFRNPTRLAPSHTAPIGAARRAFTLVELMVTLMIISLVAAASTSMMVSSANVQRYVLNNTNAVSQTELAFRRIVENIRSSSQATCVPPSELDLVTQPNTTVAGNPVYNVKYMLAGSQLLEVDDRYGFNVLATNVTTFTITTVQATKPTMFQITLTATPAGSPPITRQTYVTARNF